MLAVLIFYFLLLLCLCGCGCPKKIHYTPDVGLSLFLGLLLFSASVWVWGPVFLHTAYVGAMLGGCGVSVGGCGDWLFGCSLFFGLGLCVVQLVWGAGLQLQQ